MQHRECIPNWHGNLQLHSHNSILGLTLLSNPWNNIYYLINVTPMDKNQSYPFGHLQPQKWCVIKCVWLGLCNPKVKDIFTTDALDTMSYSSPDICDYGCLGNYSFLAKLKLLCAHRLGTYWFPIFYKHAILDNIKDTRGVVYLWKRKQQQNWSLRLTCSIQASGQETIR